MRCKPWIKEDFKYYGIVNKKKYLNILVELGYIKKEDIFFMEEELM